MGKSASAGAVLAIGALLLIGIALCVLCNSWRKKRKRHQNYEDPDPPAKASSGNYYDEQCQSNQQNEEGHVHNSANKLNSTNVNAQKVTSEGTFTYEELASATNEFCKENMLGEGTFGCVHKGVLPNGKAIAVKTLKSGDSQALSQFKAEVDLISSVHHPHLVDLKGYCIARPQRFLVFEFVPNNNLEHHLHGKGVRPMSWSNRQRIAIGIAKGLSYLHDYCNPQIVHRDIKAANVLIDDSFEAKVADYGLAKAISDNNTHVSTRVMGTLGYLAPEYASSGKLTDKSDVFSFGVMLLEIISGKRPMDLSHALDDTLVDWARPLLNRGLEDGNFGELVDPFLERNYNNQEVARMAACAAASIRHSAKRRPKMRQILLALEGKASMEDLNDASIPAYKF